MGDVTRPEIQISDDQWELIAIIVERETGLRSGTTGLEALVTDVLDALGFDAVFVSDEPGPETATYQQYREARRLD